MHMKLQTTISFLALALFAPPSPAQAESPVDALRNALSGQRFLVTNRVGGVLYGTFYFYNVQYCPTGTYITAARSEKTTVLENTQVNTWTEAGRWEVLDVRGQTVVKYVSTQRKTTVLPVKLLPDGSIWLGPDIYVSRQGLAACR
jgi:hypothetical protein